MLEELYGRPSKEEVKADRDQEEEKNKEKVAEVEAHLKALEEKLKKAKSSAEIPKELHRDIEKAKRRLEKRRNATNITDYWYYLFKVGWQSVGYGQWDTTWSS